MQRRDGGLMREQEKEKDQEWEEDWEKEQVQEKDGAAWVPVWD